MKNRQDVQDKIDQYRTFLDTTLRPQLKRAKAEQDAVLQEQEAYRALQDEIKRLDNNNNNNNDDDDDDAKMRMTTMTVDLGWNKAYCEAKVQQNNNNNNNNNSTAPLLIAVDVGMGFHVEMTPAQGTAFCHARLQLLQSKYNYRHEALRKIQQHVDMAMDILDHLANEALSM